MRKKTNPRREELETKDWGSGRKLVGNEIKDRHYRSKQVDVPVHKIELTTDLRRLMCSPNFTLLLNYECSTEHRLPQSHELL